MHTQTHTHIHTHAHKRAHTHIDSHIHTQAHTYKQFPNFLISLLSPGVTNTHHSYPPEMTEVVDFFKKYSNFD